MTGAATRLPRVAVLGVGNVGGVLAASLISARKAEVHLMSREVGLKVLKDTGLSVKTQENSEPISFTQQAGDFNVMSNGEAERASAGGRAQGHGGGDTAPLAGGARRTCSRSAPTSTPSSAVA